MALLLSSAAPALTPSQSENRTAWFIQRNTVRKLLKHRFSSLKINKNSRFPKEFEGGAGYSCVYPLASGAYFLRYRLPTTSSKFENLTRDRPMVVAKKKM